MPWVNVEVETVDPPSRREIDEVVTYAKQKKTRPRFYADENFPQRAIDVLSGWGFDVLCATDAGRRGHPDENHLAEAQKQSRFFLTCDRDYLNEKRFPLISCSALAVFDFGRGTRTEIVRAFRAIQTVFAFPQFYDKWTKIDAKPGEWIERKRYQNGSTSRERHRVLRGRLQVWRDL